MSRQILLCVETNKTARTDYMYVVAAIKHFMRMIEKWHINLFFLSPK